MSIFARIGNAIGSSSSVHDSIKTGIAAGIVDAAKSIERESMAGIANAVDAWTNGAPAIAAMRAVADCMHQIKRAQSLAQFIADKK